tara:strand:+ start:2024 stop:2206 length:183 start_codon:yes stop_codon:yes gene_type:complete
MSVTEIDDTEAKVVDWDITFEFDNGKHIPIFQVLTDSDAGLVDQLICDLVVKEGIWHERT